MRRFAILLMAALLLADCGGHDRPPSGRWVGHYESPTVMVVAWMEILPSGEVRVSAPDILDVGEPDDAQREVMHARLADEISGNWSLVKPRRYDFDGKVFRKPGGVAPQMEWNPKTKEMKLVFYFGMQRSIRIRMQAVKEFSEDPWLPK